MNHLAAFPLLLLPRPAHLTWDRIGGREGPAGWWLTGDPLKTQAVPTPFDMHHVWGVPWEWAYGGLGGHLQPTLGCEAESPQKPQKFIYSPSSPQHKLWNRTERSLLVLLSVLGDCRDEWGQDNGNSA